MIAELSLKHEKNHGFSVSFAYSFRTALQYRQGAGGERRDTRGTQNGGRGRGGGFNCVSLVKGSTLPKRLQPLHLIGLFWCLARWPRRPESRASAVAATWLHNDSSLPGSLNAFLECGHHVFILSEIFLD